MSRINDKGGFVFGESDDEPLIVDADPRNADWIKTLAWDLPTDPDVFVGAVLGAEPGTPAEQVRRAWEHFKTLPAFRPMPPKLRDQVEEIVAEWES